MVVLCSVRIVLGGVRVVVALGCVCCVQSAEGCVGSAGVRESGCFVVAVLCAVRIVLGGVRVVVALRRAGVL